MVPIGEVVDFIGGGTPSRDVSNYWNGDIPWASVKDFKSPSIDSTLESITHEGLSASSSALIPAGHVIMPTRMALGKAAINSIDVAINQDLKALRLRIRIDTRYLLHAILSRAKEIQSHGKGATVQGITIERLSAIQIPLPPLEEQRRIAAILDKGHRIHSLAAERAKISADSLYRSLLTQEIERPDAEWVKLGDVLEIARGGSPRPIQAFLTNDPDGINWIMIGDAGVGEKFITKTAKKIRSEGLSKTRLVKEGDLLLSNSMSFGRPYIMKTDGAIHDGWLVLRDMNATCSPDYLYHVLGSPICYSQFARAAAGATVKNLNTSIVSSVEIPLPPLEKQVEIAERLDAVEIHVGSAFASLVLKAEQLKSSLANSLLQEAS